MWLLHMEQIEGVDIKHVRNGHEYRLSELPHYGVCGYCAETYTIYEFFGCYWLGCTCQTFRDFITTNGDSLATRYEQTMARLVQITRAGYQFKDQWECEFDDVCRAIPVLLAQPTVCKSPLFTREAMYRGRTEAMRQYYKAREVETIQYADVMSLYPYVCQYGKFPVPHSVVNVGDSCKDKEAYLSKEGLIKCTNFLQRDCIIPCSHSVPIRNSCSGFAEQLS